MFDRIKIFIRNEQPATPRKTMDDLPITVSQFNNSKPLYFTEQGGDRFVLLEGDDGRYVSFINSRWVIECLRRMGEDHVASLYAEHLAEHTVVLQNQLMKARGR